VRELDIGYRVPREILDYASRLLPSIAPGLASAVSLRGDPDALAVVRVDGAELGERVAAACASALAGPGSVAVICADAWVGEVRTALAAAGLAFELLGGDAVQPAAEDGPQASAQGRLTLVPVTLAKGLEFDHVVLVEPAAIATGEAYGLRRLYVALTRAVSRLTVFHAEPLPTALALRTMKEAHITEAYPGAFAKCVARSACTGILADATRLVPGNLLAVTTVVFCGTQGEQCCGDCLPRQAGRGAFQQGI
jgi:hypothetical protein